MRQKPDRTTTAHTKACLRWILDQELQDFKENISMRHPYFRAYYALHGKIRANEMLAQTVQGVLE